MVKKVFYLVQILILFMVANAQYIFGQTDKKIPDYSLTDRKDIPVEYTWKIEDLYPSDDAWRKDKDVAVDLISKIDGLQKNWTSSSSNMISLLELISQINIKSGVLYAYASHQAASDIGDTKFQKMEGELQSIFVNYYSKLSFINPDVIALGKENVDKYISEEPKLKPYSFMLYDIIRNKDYILPEEQQKIVSMTGLFSGVPSKAANMLNDMELPTVDVTLSDGTKVKLNYANYVKFRGDKDPANRSLVMKEFWNNMKNYENTFSILQDGAVKNHLFNAKVKKFENCLDAKLFNDNIPREVYTNLIKSVKENLSPLHRYLKLKQKLLKLEKYRYEDIYASAVPSVEKIYTFSESEKLIKESMRPLGNEYLSALNEAYKNRWMDVYPNKNKESGAYSGGVYGVHPYVKLNYNGEYESVSTVAHELGHALHSYLSNKYQPFVTSDYTTFLAEIASTFNENMLMEYMLKNETDDTYKLFILDAYLDQVRGTLYRQTLFADFELAMHEKVEEGKTLTADWLNEKYLNLTREYYGHDKGVTYVDEYIQREWSRIPHFFYNFYVFQYSTGIISSMALAEMVLNGGDKERDAYVNMLKSGGKDYSINILKEAGVDMTTKEPYEKAFKRFDYLVSEMEKIMVRLNK